MTTVNPPPQEQTTGKNDGSQHQLTSTLSINCVSMRPVTFEGVRRTYLPGTDINIRLKVENSCKLRKKDWIALLQVPWNSPKDYITFQWTSKTIKSKGCHHVTFPAGQLPPANPHTTYQFLYVEKRTGQILGVSTPFCISQVAHNVRRLLEEAAGHAETSASCASIPSISLWEDMCTLNVEFAVDRNIFCETGDNGKESATSCLELEPRRPLSVMPWSEPQHFWTAGGWRKPIFSIAKVKPETVTTASAATTTAAAVMSSNGAGCPPPAVSVPVFAFNSAASPTLGARLWASSTSVPSSAPLSSSPDGALAPVFVGSGATPSVGHGRATAAGGKTATTDLLRSSNVRLKKRCDLLSESNRKLAASASHKARKIKLLLERIKSLEDQLQEFPELKITAARLREENNSLITAQEQLCSQLNEAQARIEELERHVDDVRYTLTMEGYDSIIDRDGVCAQLPPAQSSSPGALKQLDLRNWTVKDAAVKRLGRSLEIKDERLAKCNDELTSARAECAVLTAELRSLKASHARLLGELSNKTRQNHALTAENRRTPIADHDRSDSPWQSEFMEIALTALKALLQDSQEQIRAKDADLISAHQNVAELNSRLADVQKQVEEQCRPRCCAPPSTSTTCHQRQRCCCSGGTSGRYASEDLNISRRQGTLAAGSQPSKSASWFAQQPASPSIGCSPAAAVGGTADQSVSDMSLSAAFARLFGTASQQSIPSSASTSTESIASVLRLLFREDGLSSAASTSNIAASGPAPPPAVRCASASVAAKNDDSVAFPDEGTAINGESRKRASTFAQTEHNKSGSLGRRIALAPPAATAVSAAKSRRRKAKGHMGIQSPHLKERLVTFRWARENKRCPHCDIIFADNTSRSTIRRHLNQHSNVNDMKNTESLPMPSRTNE